MNRRTRWLRHGPTASTPPCTRHCSQRNWPHLLPLVARRPGVSVTASHHGCRQCLDLFHSTQSPLLSPRLRDASTDQPTAAASDKSVPVTRSRARGMKLEAVRHAPNRTRSSWLVDDAMARRGETSKPDLGTRSTGVSSHVGHQSVSAAPLGQCEARRHSTIFCLAETASSRLVPSRTLVLAVVSSPRRDTGGRVSLGELARDCACHG